MEDLLRQLQIKVIALLQKYVVQLEKEVNEKHMDNSAHLYQVSLRNLGKRKGLDKSIPKEVNCANALTAVLIESGVKGLPPKGIPGTASLFAWLTKSRDFIRVTDPKPGDVLVYPTGYGNGKIQNGHVFIMGKQNPMSNNSKTGLWDAHWDSLQEADDFYTRKGGIPRFVFRWVVNS